MKKTIGTDIAFSGNINGSKLCQEIEGASITEYTLEMDPDTGELYLSFDGALEPQINAILAAHDPAPEPEPLTLEEQVEVLDGAMNELLFEILPSLQGGEI
ncbi:hypothetical protein [Eubacterium callanderi]|uniref:hypothetical protein n=1 Tax=Eubacterium callanderi TaxID=53442 RepID=UPI001D06F340|nr:hypothetical protein [Eubacterium callanderi]MCB6660254.1 hypothetical protein [Eubacterium callanderi]MCB6753197.1 hypothetical protein [Eubacterium callanderi]MCB7105077.1 hypothetical protein [Eubacterium callanderi]MCG4820580.1 hypothetical protein [Eubacterium callanderi]MCQ5190454.1 hypothetical protein [Eubacterium callanderi]